MDVYSRQTRFCEKFSDFASIPGNICIECSTEGELTQASGKLLPGLKGPDSMELMHLLSRTELL